MQLFICAHKAEATAFLRNMRFESCFNKVTGLYNNNQDLLLISGEGMDQTADKLEIVLKHFENDIQCIINFGIAGSLKKNIDLASIHFVSKVLHEDTLNNPVFYNSVAKEGITCVSVSKAVSSQDLAVILSEKADIVDMELWIVAFLCAQHGIPFLSFKLISDFAFKRTDLSLIKKTMPQYNQKLYQYYKSNLLKII